MQNDNISTTYFHDGAKDVWLNMLYDLENKVSQGKATREEHRMIVLLKTQLNRVFNLY